MNRWRSFFIVLLATSEIVALILPAFAQTAVPSVSSIATSTVTSTTIAIVVPMDPNAAVASTVQSYFADIPVMAAIAKCESGPRQFVPDGSLLYAGAGGRMIGVFQIDSSIHTVPALALGFDIATLAGNLGYARYLYGAEGTAPWISSFGCWGPMITSTPSGGVESTNGTGTIGNTTSATSPALTINLSIGAIDPQVLILQQLLNKTGFTLAPSGPGSPGNETTKFGALTYVALKKFQCVQGIACSGDEATTGYGYANAQTRRALVAMAGLNTTPGSASTGAGVAASSTTPTSTASTDNAAEIASLQSRIAALVVIVQQLEAQLALRM